MTVPSSTFKSGPYNGNGVTTVFDYEFRILAAGDLRVIHTDGDGTETAWAQGTDYAVSGVGDSGGGSVTATTAPASGSTITILRSIDFLQETDLVNQGPYYAEVVEEQFDRMVMRDQQMQEQIDRTLKIPASDELVPRELPAAALRAGKALVFDELGDLIISTDDYENQAAAAAASAASAGSSATTATEQAALANAHRLNASNAKDAAEAAAATAVAVTGIDGVATETEAEEQDEADASEVKVITVLRMLQGIRASLKERGEIDLYTMGAKGDGSAADGLLVQAAIDEAENSPYGRLYGRTVVIPTGIFAVDLISRNGIEACLHSTGAAHIVGRGRHSCITPLASVPGYVPTLIVKPTDTEAAAGLRIANFFMGETGTGQRQGLDGILLDTRVAGSNLPTPIITGMYICQSRDAGVVNYGAAISHLNDQTQNVNGGMYGAMIWGNRALNGGVRLNETGDSNTIGMSVISGQNNAALGFRCIGVDATLCTSDGGAGLITLEKLNITTQAGAYRINTAKDVQISQVYGEHLDADAGIPNPVGGRSLAIISSGSDTIFGGSVRGGRLAAATGVSTAVTSNLYIANVASMEIGGGISLYPGKASGGYGIEFESSSYENKVVGTVYWGPGLSAENRIVDRGVRNLFAASTTPVLQANFSEFGSGYDGLSVKRTSDGAVTITGLLTHVAGGTSQLMFTLPAGFRPAAALRPGCTADASGTSVPGIVDIQTNGAVTYQGDATATRLALNISYNVSTGGPSV